MILLTSVLAILAVWTGIALALIGIGSVLLRLFTRDYALLDSFWVALAVSVAFLELWNLLIPISSAATLVLVCAGLLGLLINRAVLLSRLKSSLHSGRWLILSCLAMAALIALRATGPCEHYDTGLYGASAARWILTYPVVPGLANLHGRLGFNSSVFLCLAALRQGLWKDLEYHLFDGLLLAAIWLTILPACFRLARGLGGPPSDSFHCILAIPMFFWTTRTKIVGALTDEPATIACLVATGILFDELHLTHDAGDAIRRQSSLARLFVAASLYSLAVAFKESTVIFAALAWLIVSILALSKARLETNARLRIAVILAISILIVIPWLARGTILSGYPFYPSTAFAFPVDWKVPVAAAHHDFIWVQSWGRIPDAPLSDTRGFAWLPVWFNRCIRNRPSFQVPLLISVVGLAAAFVFRAREKLRSSLASGWLLIPSLAAIIFWFFAAPDPRFAQFAIWTLAGVLGSWGITAAAKRFAASPRLSASRFNLIVLAGLFALLVWCQISFGWRGSLQSVSAKNALAPLPSVTVLPRKTQSGLTVYVPAAGSQCWDAPLPCTPHFDESLRLRNSQSMRQGFLPNGRVD
jgi:hypothetical protein